MWDEALDRDALEGFVRDFGLTCLLEGSVADDALREPIEDGGGVPLVFDKFMLSVAILRSRARAICGLLKV